MADLDGVYAKLGRARVHARDLKERVDFALESSRYGVLGQFNSQTSQYVYRVERLPVIDPEWGLILGDFLTNMRAALDHLYYQLPKLENADPAEHDGFPIVDCPKVNGETGLIRPPRVVGVTEVGVLDALEAVQPYKAAVPANNWLSVLNVLVNTDKHRLLLVVACSVDTDLMWWGLQDGAVLRLSRPSISKP